MLKDNIVLLEYFKQTMTKAQFNIYMSFIKSGVIGINNEDSDPYDYDIYDDIEEYED